ncbi:uncharacterized protein LOC106012231, partial [Aplysia californica]|uniref:Uncharacterized protein LOC106012231 n=1 Tax=Aplysia californica TaxID=6500 RepID=A0ABM1VVT5_APLCA
MSILVPKAIPGLWNKRMFIEMSRRVNIMSHPCEKGLLAVTQLKRGNSSRVSELISPGTTLFHDLYEDSSRRISTCSSKVEPNKLGAQKDAKTATLPKSARRLRSGGTVPWVQDDMESVGHLMSPAVTPRTPRSARTLLPEQINEHETVTMSPRMHYPDDEDDLEKARESIQKKKRVRYLLSLVNFNVVNKGVLLHAASSYGNTLLLKGIMSSPMCKPQKQDKSSFSPFLYALANYSPEASEFCLGNEMGPFEADPFTDVLCFVLLRRFNFQTNHQTLRKLLNRFTIAKETIRGIKMILIPKTEMMKKFWLRGTLLNLNQDVYDDEYLVRLIQLAIKHDNGAVSSRLLMVMAATGQSMILSAILGVVKDPTHLTEMFKRKVVHNATVLDLLFVLAPSRLTKEQHQPEYLERMKIINAMSDVVRLEIAARTLSAAVRKNLLPMVEMIVKDHTRNHLPLQPAELWYEALYKAAEKGELDFINTICVAEINAKPEEVQAAMLKALCLACLRRHRHIANRLLLFKMPLNARVEGVTGKEDEEARLSLDCAIQGGDSVIASLILQTMEETGMIPHPQDILKCIFMAFEKGMEAIVENLLRFAHVVSPTLVTVRICHMLFLSAATKGSGVVCVRFLSLPDFNVNAKDENGFTALHYASMHGKHGLVQEIVRHCNTSVEIQTPEGWTPLDLARAFGHLSLATRLVTEFKGVQGYGFGYLMNHSWLRYYLKQNEELGEDESAPVMTFSAGARSRDLGIVSLVKQGNDLAASCMIEVAQESIVACFLYMYHHFPLLHFCAKSNCYRTLDILMKLIEAQPTQNLKEYLQKEVSGKIPLCVAVESCNVQCIKLLVKAFFPKDWRYSLTGESMLHFAAKTNKPEVIEIFKEFMDNELLQAQDKDGLIPATTAVALGHHTTLHYFLGGLRFAEKLHHDHMTTTYWCVLCLLDCCIGWSRVFLQSDGIPLTGNGRNIFQRHRTESGFCVYSHNGSQALTSHTLHTIHSWVRLGASKELLTAALSTMQYSMNGFKSELFLQLSRKTRYEILDDFIRNGKAEIACYLYEKLCPSLEMKDKVWHFMNAVAFGREEVVKKILQLSGEEMSKINYEGDYSAIDVAIAFGHTNLISIVADAFENQTSLTSLKYFSTERSSLPLNVKWSLGLASIGDKDWRASIDYSTERLSHVDVYLSKSGAINSFPADLLPRDIMPMSLRDKAIEVNHKSLQNVITELGVTDIYLTSVLVSKAVLCRYYDNVDERSDGWAAVQKIVLHCVTSGSQESAKTELQWKDLHDTV